MITVLTGGKAAQSLVKFAKFYLIIDSHDLSEQDTDPTILMPFYQKFIAALKSAFASTK